MLNSCQRRVFFFLPFLRKATVSCADIRDQSAISWYAKYIVENNRHQTPALLPGASNGN